MTTGVGCGSGLTVLFLFHDCLFANFFASFILCEYIATMGIQISYQFKGRWIIRQFEDEQVVVGRPNSQHSVDIDLSPDTTVSRLHARIWAENGRFWVEDVESRYGTQINGKKLVGKAQIQPEDSIIIGETTLKVDNLPPAEA